MIKTIIQFLMAKETHFLYIFYIFLGLSGSVVLPVKFVLQDDLNVQPSEFELIFRVSAGLWMIKFIVGFLINPLVNKLLSYKILLTICLIINSTAWFFLSSWSPVEITNVKHVTGILFVVFSSLCIMDVASDGRMIKHAISESESNKGNTQTLSWGFRSFGSLIGGIAIILLVNRDGLAGVSPRQFMNGFVIIPLLYLLLLWGGINDNKYPPIQENGPYISFKTVLKELWNNFKENWKILLFIFTVFITPSSGSNMYLYLSESIEHHGLGFDTHILGGIGLIDASACILGAILYKKCMRKINIRYLFFVCFILSGLISVSQLFILLGTYKKYNIPPEIFIISDDALGSILGQLILLPLMIVVAHTIPSGLETVLYSGYTSYENVLSSLSSFISAWMTTLLGIEREEDGTINFDKLWIMLIITSLLSIIPIFFLFLIPPRISSYTSLHEIGEDEEEEDGDIEMVEVTQHESVI